MKVVTISIILFLLFVTSFNAIAQDLDSKKAAAEQLYMQKDYAGALSAYEEMLKMTDLDSTVAAEVYSSAGICCVELNKNDIAISYFTEAVKRNVPQLMIYDKLISMAKDADNNDIYEFALLQKQNAFPEFEIEVKQKLAYLYFSSKQYEKLLPITANLLEWYPDYGTYHLYDAIAKQSLNDVEGAEIAYGKVLELEPDNSGASMGKGMILYNRAMNLYNKLKTQYEAKDKPDRVDYSNYRKSLEEPKRMYAEALPYLLKAYENKSYSSLKGIIKNTYLRLEDTESANKYE